MLIHSNIPDKIPGKIDIGSDSGRIRFFRENGGGADWRIGIIGKEGEYLTTEFACHGARSPNTVHAISFGLRTLDEPVDIIEPIEDTISATRLSDQDFILITIGLVRENVNVTLERKKELSGRDDCMIKISAIVDNVQYTFFRRVIDGLKQDNQENPLEIPE